MFGIGASGGASSSDSSSKSEQFVWGPQEGALSNMYGQAGGLYNQQAGLNPQFQNFMMSQVNPFMMGLNPYMMQGFGQQMGGGLSGQAGQETMGALSQSLQGSLGGQPSNTSRMYQDIVGGEGNSYIDPVIDDMYSNAWQSLDRGAFKNEAQRAAGSGNMGNYNRQMNNTLHAENMMNNVRTQENQLRAGAYDQDLNWKMQIAQQADSNLGASQDRAMQLLGMGDQNQQFGLGQGLGMQQFGMGMANPWMAMQQMPWANMNAYANVLGDPTVLGKSSSKAESDSWNAGISV